MDVDYRKLNRANWDDRAPLHAASTDYAMERFRSDRSYISDVVRFDVPLLGDIRGLRGVHLQCHIGTDTISLARLGATMTGLDFSPASLVQARLLAEQVGTAVDFVESDVYDAVSVLGKQQFDLVFTGIGALCWLPSIQRWAQTVADLLRPGGQLFLREGHPVLWSVDEEQTDRLVIGYPYFETEKPMEFTGGTYVDVDGTIDHPSTQEWNHGLGEIVQALIETGLTITGLTEHDSAPWEALPGRMARDDDGEWRLTEHRERLPLSYTLQARKP
ncbi:class I SAM-dependent methyltransferase [Nocardia sp. NPDC050406]|uniref:class I SAM-dependent methyltransferase n=1 Tax=Nocardia sp. NPDC050406 TaxID=3364318 RepID=UPI0037967DB5